MTNTAVFRRQEFETAALDFGALQIDLQDYMTTGLRVVTVGPSGIGKTNTGLVLAEQLAAQGWVSVLMDPEGEIAALYGEPVKDAAELARWMYEHREIARDDPRLVAPRLTTLHTGRKTRLGLIVGGGLIERLPERICRITGAKACPYAVREIGSAESR